MHPEWFIINKIDPKTVWKRRINMNENMEECVSCGTQTDINIDTHVNYRRHYISGVGQLCASCGEKYDNPNEEGIRIPHPTKGKKIGNKEDEDLFMFGPDAM